MQIVEFKYKIQSMFIVNWIDYLEHINFSSDIIKIA